MNNAISIIMLGLVVAACIAYMLKALRRPATGDKEQKWGVIFFMGAGTGFVVGMLLGVTCPQTFFSNTFLRKEGAELGAIALLSIGFSVIGGLLFLPLYSHFRKRA